MIKNRTAITQDELKHRLYYDEFTGIFTWIKPHPNNKICKPGYRAGSLRGPRFGKKYHHIMINGVRYNSHALAFLYMTGELPDCEIDHIDGNGLNNQWKNLRKVKKGENSKNVRLDKNNKLGIPGIYYRKKQNKYVAEINNENKWIYLGYFKDFFEACCVRKAAEKKYNYHPNHGKVRSL